MRSTPKRSLSWDRFDGVDQTRDIAREYGDRARAALAKFPPSSEREALEAALEFVLIEVISCTWSCAMRP